MFRNLYPSILIFALAIGGSYAWIQSRDTPTGNTDIAALDNLVEVTDVQATDGEAPEVMEMILGDENAPVTIVEYASFTCPHCANFHTTVFEQIKKEYVDAGKVRFIVRDIYFDRFGLWAAMLARCEPEKFFGVSDLIYTKQREWTTGESNAEVVQNLMKLGRLAGMNDDQMDACMQDNAMAQALVNAYQKNAEQDEISSTPSFLINGKKFENMGYAEFKEAIDSLLTE